MRARRAGREMRGILEIAGILFGVPTVVSLIQHIWGFELAGVLLLVLEQYRQLLAPVFEFIQQPIAWFASLWHYQLPAWLNDLHTLSFIGASFGYRALQKSNEPVTEGIWTYLSSIVWGAMFLGLYFIAKLVVSMFFGRRTQDQEMHTMFDAGWITALGVSIFYLANHAMVLRWIPGFA
jgi:hypothetical protein